MPLVVEGYFDVIALSRAAALTNAVASLGRHGPEHQQINPALPLLRKAPARAQFRHRWRRRCVPPSGRSRGEQLALQGQPRIAGACTCPPGKDPETFLKEHGVPVNTAPCWSKRRFWLGLGRIEQALEGNDLAPAPTSSSRPVRPGGTAGQACPRSAVPQPLPPAGGPDVSPRVRPPRPETRGRPAPAGEGRRWQWPLGAGWEKPCATCSLRERADA